MTNPPTSYTTSWDTTPIGAEPARRSTLFGLVVQLVPVVAPSSLGGSDMDPA